MQLASRSCNALCCSYPSRMHDQSVVTDPFFNKRPWRSLASKSCQVLSHRSLRQDTLVQHYLPAVMPFPQALMTAL